MAISIIQSASTLSPAYNPVVFVVDSTNKNQNSFRYIFDIYNSDTNVEIASLKVAPEPMSGYGYTDISRILNSQVSYDLDPNDYQYSAPNSYINYRLVLSEEYLYSWDFSGITWTPGDGYYTLNGSSDAVWNLNNSIEIDVLSGDTWSDGLHIVISSPNPKVIVLGEYGGTSGASGTVYWANRTKTTSTSNTITGRTAFNGVRSFGDFLNYSAATYIIPDSGADATRKLLTDMPNEFYATPEQDIWLNLFSKETNVNTLRVRVQNSNGDVFRTVVWNNSPADGNVVQFAIGPNNYSATTVVSGSLPVIKSGTTYYDFKIVNGANDTLTQTYRVYLDRRCKIEDYEILFLDRMGSFVSYAFQLRSKETGTIERKNYNKFLGTIDNTGWSYETTDAGQTNYNINLQKELELNTDWMNDDMSVYFEQLLTSPVTFLKDSDGLYYPVIIQDNGFETMRQKNKNLIKKSIKVRFANQQNINI